MKKKKITKGPNKVSKKISQLNIVKRRGHVEVYDDRKVYGSCYFACRNAHLSEVESEWISSKVCSAVRKYVNKNKVVISDDIFRIVIEELKRYDNDAAFLYETHRDIS